MTDLGLELLALDGYRYRLGVDALGQIEVTRVLIAFIITEVTLGTPPESYHVTDADSTDWYISPTILGTFLADTTPPAGVVLEAGTGFELLALDGYRYAIGVDTLGQVTTTRTTFVGRTPHEIEVAALRDPDAVTWYLWIENSQLENSETIVLSPTSVPVFDLQDNDPHVLEVCAFRDSADTVWYVWMESDGYQGASVVVSPTLPDDVWRYGALLLLPRIQWGPPVRGQEAQRDTLTLTGTAFADAAYAPCLGWVWNAQPGYLQEGV